jgi:predicted membrane-bound spermidine synthase
VLSIPLAYHHRHHRHHHHHNYNFSLVLFRCGSEFWYLLSVWQSVSFPFLLLFVAAFLSVLPLTSVFALSAAVSAAWRVRGVAVPLHGATALSAALVSLRQVSR